MKDEEFRELEREYRAMHRKYVWAGMAVVVLITGGAVVYRHLMHLSWVDAFYFCTVTLTTVGYGDITPHTDAAKLFTILYILAGVGVIATFASLLVSHASLRREYRKGRKARKG